MKIADVKIGEQYWTKVAGTPACVVALEIQERQTHSGRTRKVIIVRRLHEASPLPKARSAAALRPCKTP
jgi:hypothetical protein